ncbi:hypothetical protein Tco_0006336 [Tanacetum coccineum]
MDIYHVGMSVVILFGAIPAIIPVIPEVLVVPSDPIVTLEVGTVSVVSPAGVLDLVDYSPSSDSDPLEDYLPPAPDLSLVSPFLCFDDTEADGESEPAEQRPVSSSIAETLYTHFSEFTLATVVAPPRIHTKFKDSFRPIPAYRLAWRRVSHHSSDRHSSPDSSSFSALLDHSLSGHTPPDTTCKVKWVQPGKHCTKAQAAMPFASGKMTNSRCGTSGCPATASCSLPLPNRNMPRKREEKEGLTPPHLHLHLPVPATVLLPSHSFKLLYGTQTTAAQLTVAGTGDEDGDGAVDEDGDGDYEKRLLL